MRTKNLIPLAAAIALAAVGCVAQVGPGEESVVTGKTAETLGKTPVADPNGGDPGDQGQSASPNKVVDPGSEVAAGEQEGPWPVPWKGSSYESDPRKPTPDPGPQEQQPAKSTK